MLGEREPITPAEKLHTFLGYRPWGWKAPKKANPLKGTARLMEYVRQQEANKSSLYARVKKAVQERFQRKAGGK